MEKFLKKRPEMLPRPAVHARNGLLYEQKTQLVCGEACDAQLYNISLSLQVFFNVVLLLVMPFFFMVWSREAVRLGRACSAKRSRKGESKDMSVRFFVAVSQSRRPPAHRDVSIASFYERIKGFRRVLRVNTPCHCLLEM